MSDDQASLANESSQEELAHRQAIKYGQDLARVYKAEKAKREKLELANQALSAVFAAMPDGLVVLDDTLVIRQANPVFEQWAEAAPGSATGQALTGLLPADGLVSALRLLATDPTAPTQVELVVEQPVKRSLLANIARLEAGHSRGWIVVLHDQSERKRLEFQKTEFINLAAHELRTPLGIILGYAQLLQAEFPGGVHEEIAAFLSRIIHAGYRLESIINELLEFARVHRGEADRQGPSEIDLNALIQDVVSEAASHAAEKQVVVQIDSTDLMLQIKADASLLCTALRQLVLNGIKFNPAGGCVRIAATAAGDEIVLQVADTGVGIPQSELDAIFRPFFQVEDHRTRHASGLGLGLSIVQRAVARLGGRVNVESKLGRGTTVTLHLPIEQPSAEDELGDLKARLQASHRQSLAYARDLHQLYVQLRHANKQLAQVNRHWTRPTGSSRTFWGSSATNCAHRSSLSISPCKPFPATARKL